MLLFPTFPIAQFSPVPVKPTVPVSVPGKPQSVVRPTPPPQPPNNALPPQPTLAPQPLLAPKEVIRLREIRPLQGQLDNVPVFNSNSPELVKTEGILLSTFPKKGMRHADAHLEYTFNQRFDFFSHHITRARNQSQTRSLFQGVLVYNPGDQPATIESLQAASYLTRPDALYVDLPSYVNDPIGRVFAGPGSRVVNDVLRGRRQGSLPLQVVVPPGEVRLLMNLPIPAGKVVPTSNGRSTLMRLKTNAPVHVANLAMYAPQDAKGRERVPKVEQWVNLLINGKLAGPRDRVPTPPDNPTNRIIYGRVSGVAVGSRWEANLTDGPKSKDLTIPKRGRAFSYGISLLPNGTFGTGQVQSAPMVVRYPDTAYLANGNYGIQYSLTLPLYNNTRKMQSIAVMLETPIKQDRAKNQAIFSIPPQARIFYRGTVRLRYRDDSGNRQTRYIHLVQRRGQQGEPLAQLNLAPKSRRTVEVDFLYPPDATPPQLLTVQTGAPQTQTASMPNP
ncbi:DUF3370 domain-containing protein [filamentous cyanobacterium LEGE 11480]|uniref:DUF3370 domain-containing protein n=1 Tax=Romeriopsis navalis LEGE 11480 TaxID=2777977 RepID=A0A928VPF7_9CYAN|nr:DUF3370 domain-containing protein [Romeriopsis navalis]MBE9032271.1 DUF3370 domain-containing protein [Romeriopsis navalis LEGE 11480]